MENPMPRLMVLFLAAAHLLLSASQVLAWNSIGHMTVAKLAYDQLGSREQLALIKLLKSHPHYQAFLSASRPADLDNEVEWVVMRCSYWPDWVRPRRNDQRGLDVTRYHGGEGHYITVPFIDPKDEKAFAGKVLVDANLPNIVTAIKERADELRSNTLADSERAVAAAWLFHLVGDIHQPLHNCSYFSSDAAFVKGDLGGNKFGIKADGRKCRLHTLWDDLLGVDRDYADDSAEHQGHLFRQALKVAQELRGVQLSAEDREKLESNLSPESWSRESHQLARTIVYRKADGSGLLNAVAVPFMGEIPDTVEEVGPRYLQLARATAEKQVVLAGIRLAALLRKQLQR
jgi:hypothetical protein